MKKIITKKILNEHNISSKEYNMILNIMGREPNILELGIFSVMWSEHCSYKSTKKWLKTLPISNDKVICGPGENAGIIDIGNNDAIIFKMESHNHPSFIEPYQGAATGVGGIMRDVFTMGARPIANLNSLRFGDPKNKKTKNLLRGVVKGIGDYGNCVGIPTVGGECFFHKSYNNNILVNAMSVGLVKKNKIFYATAKGVGNPIIYVGAKTGRDGIHGATMASAEFTDDSEKQRPQVQVGDPFVEKLLLESCLELMNQDVIVAIQDMGAAGLTSSSFEMASKGDCGVDLFLDKVPCREKEMIPYEMMLSETQERMLMIIKPEKRKETYKIFKKWGLEAVEIGKLTNTNKMNLYFNKELVGTLPIKPLADSAPEYDRPSSKPKRLKKKKAIKKIISKEKLKKVLITILSSPNHSSKSWIFNQYDSSVMGDTIFASEMADAAVIRIHNSKKAISITSDCNPIYCKADPKLGAEIAVAESWRNLISTGADPIAITDNLNFGNPEKKEIMYEIKQAIKGIKKACEELNYPVVSGNVSLYNETKGKAILPTPVIGGVGLIKNLNYRKGFKMNEKSFIYLVGKSKGHLDLSVFNQHLNIKGGNPPKVNFTEEINNGNFVKKLIQKTKIIDGCHDISEGGVALALAELCIANKMGMKINFLKNKKQPEKILFCEDQSRYILIVNNKKAFESLARNDGISFQKIGIVGGKYLDFESQFKITVKKLLKTNSKWFKNYLR